MPNQKPEHNLWDFFWSEYMVWSVRLISYFSNALFWDSMRNNLESIIPFSLVSDAMLWIYSILCFGVLEQAVVRKFNPKYENLGLSKAVYDDRVRKERIMITAWFFCGVNFIAGTIASLIMNKAFSVPAVLGLVGLVAGSLCSVFGSAFMAARNVKTNGHDPLLIFMGLCALLPSVVYILFMFHYEFLS